MEIAQFVFNVLDQIIKTLEMVGFTNLSLIVLMMFAGQVLKWITDFDVKFVFLVFLVIGILSAVYYVLVEAHEILPEIKFTVLHIFGAAGFYGFLKLFWPKLTDSVLFSKYKVNVKKGKVQDRRNGKK
jgi:hypothetical protein